MSIQGGYVRTTDVNGITTWSNPTSAVLTGFVGTTGAITGADTILTAIQKIDGGQTIIETTLDNATSLNVPATLVERDGSGMSAFGEIQTDSIENYTGTTGGTIDIGSQTSTSTLNMGCGTSVQVVNIGTGSGATTINVGATGDTISISGTLATINTTNLNVVDKNITLNKNGASASGANAGIDVEENNVSEGYVRVSGDRSKWVCKVPSSATIFDIVAAPTGTSAATPSTLVARDSNGRSDFVSTYTTNLNVNSSDMTAETYGLTGTWSGPRTTGTFTLKLKRIGDLVFINIPVMGEAGASTTTPTFTFSTAVPSGFRPTNSAKEIGYCQITTLSDSINTKSGAIAVTSSGTLTIEATGGQTFTNGALSGCAWATQFSFRNT